MLAAQNHVSVWAKEPLYLEEEYLSRLEEIIKSAKLTGVGNCGYGAKLTLTLENGETVVVFKGTDDCGSLVFGSWGGYSISDEPDDEFWEMFGLSTDAHTRQFPDSEETQDEYSENVEENTEEPVMEPTEGNTEKSVAGVTMVDTSKVSGIVVTNGNTGEKITLTAEDLAYGDLLKLYWQLDFTAEYEENTRVGYQYSMKLLDAVGNKLQSVTPYKDGVTIDGIFFKYDNTGNDAVVSLNLMEYLEYVCNPEQSPIGKSITEVSVNTLENVTMTMKTYNSCEGDIEITNESGSEIGTGEWYSLQRYEEGEWHRLDELIDGIWKEVEYRIPDGETAVFPTNWKIWYGELPSGQYRIVKEVYYHSEERIDTYYLSTEFEIN